MVATAPMKLMTIEDLLELPGDVRRELIEGRLVEMSPTQESHVMVTSRLARALGRYFDANPDRGDVWVGSGGYVVVRGPDTVTEPDLCIVSPDQAAGRSGRGKGYMPFAPMIPVEVKSPNDTEPEIAKKLGLYLAAGVAEVWWARPVQGTVVIYHPDGMIELFREDDALRSDALPGFEVAVAHLFA